MQSPEGLQAVPLGKECRTDKILKSCGNTSWTGGLEEMGREGSGPLGCFCWSKSKTSGVFGVTPGDLASFP